MKKKNFLIIILAMVMVFTTTFSVQAAVSCPSISSSKPIKAYTISTGNNTTAYSNSNLNSKIGTIYASDELYIQSIGKNSAGKYYCKLTYPTSNGRKTAYTPLSIVTNATSPSGQYKATGSITTYRRASSSSKAGSIANGDTVYKLSTSGSYVQVLYNIGSASNPSGWRMAWITTSNFNKYVNEVGSNPEGFIDSVSSNNAGQITVRGWAFDKDNLSANLPIHVYVGGAAGSGAPGYAITANTYRPDVNSVYSGVGNYHGYESTFNVSRTGKQTIYIYACNVGGGNNVLLGTRTITIKSNTSNSSTGYVINGVNIGYKAGDYFTDNGKACTDHGTKGIHSYYNESACNCICTYNGKSLGAVQCFGFARYVQTKLYGVNSYNSPNSFYQLSNSYVAAGRLTASNLKCLIQSAGVGAHIRTNGSQHSMIITDVTDTGFSIIQCNGSNNKEYSGHVACRIGTYTYTWDSYVSSTYGQRGLAFIEKIK